MNVIDNIILKYCLKIYQRRKFKFINFNDQYEKAINFILSNF